jgi:hypothetical protein
MLRARDKLKENEKRTYAKRLLSASQHYGLAVYVRAVYIFSKLCESTEIASTRVHMHVCVERIVSRFWMDIAERQYTCVVPHVVGTLGDIRIYPTSGDLAQNVWTVEWHEDTGIYADDYGVIILLPVVNADKDIDTDKDIDKDTDTMLLDAWRMTDDVAVNDGYSSDY